MIELKKIEVLEKMSHETHCYFAKLYCDGVLAAELSNHGMGGCDLVDVINREAFEKAESQVGQLEGYRDYDCPRAALESWACDQVSDFRCKKELRRLMGKRILFTVKNKNGLYQTRAARNAAMRDAWLEEFRGRNTEYSEILNDLPFTRALEIFKQETQS